MAGAGLYGVGLCCALGDTFEAATAAYRAGKRNFVRRDDVVGPDGLPVRLAPVFGFREIDDFACRLQCLFDKAAADLDAQGVSRAMPLRLIVPDWLIGHPVSERLGGWIGENRSALVRDVQYVSSSESMVAIELVRALVAVDSGDEDDLLIGAIDSFLDTQLLDLLALDDRILKRGQPHGIIPSEACVIFHVGGESSDRPPLGRVLAAWPGREECDIRKPNGVLGKGLAKGFSAAVERGAPDRLMIDLDGERWRSEELGFALAAAPSMPDELEADFETPPLFTGHCGVATGGVMTALALSAGSGAPQKNGADHETTLISTSQIDGLRLVALVERLVHESAAGMP